MEHILKPNIRTLVVDDDRLMRMMLQAQIEELGHEVVTANNGALAWDFLQQDNSIDIIVIDREMPQMNGIEVVQRIKKNNKLNHIPIIMLTGSDKAKQIREGIDAGVYYYLTKPIDQEVLTSVLTSAAREVNQHKSLSHDLQQHRSAFTLIDSCRFLINTLEHAESLACFIANCYPNPQRVALGISALLINAIEHGNLGIGYHLKTELLKNGTWAEEIARRIRTSEHSSKRVEVIFRRRQDGLQLKITDAGQGFDWRNYLKIDPSRAQDNHGRGIAQASSTSFDNVIFNEAGNEVTVFNGLEPDINW